MPRPTSPLLLPTPSRWARIGRVHARASLVLVALALIAVTALAAPAYPGDPSVHIAMIERLRHGGEDYYTAAAAVLRGADPRSVTGAVLALPALPLAMATLPPIAGLLILPLLLMLAAALGWAERAPTAGGAIVNVVLVLLGSGVASDVDRLASPALWAGLLVALALAASRSGRAAAFGTAAALIHAGILPWLLVMAVLGWREDGWQAARSWLTGALLAAIVFMLHAVALGPTDMMWNVQGPAAALAALAAATTLGSGMPGSAVALAGIAGWTAWRDPLAVRMIASVATMLVLAMADPGAPLIAAPILLLGLAPALEGLRDLSRAALDRRRITVTRVTR